MTSIENTIGFDFKKSSQVYNNFKKFYAKKNIPAYYNFNKSLSNSDNLSNLSIHILNPNSCACDLFAYKPLIIELCARLIHNPELERLYISSNNLTTIIEGSKILYSLSLILTYTSEISILTDYFVKSKAFFHSLKNCISTITQTELQEILLSFYRLINTDRQKFYTFIDPQILHSIISNGSCSNINKYLSILILSKYLYLAEEVKIEMINKNVDQNDLIGTLDGDNNINFKYFTLFESQRLSNLSKLTPIQDCFESSQFTINFNEDDLSPGVSIIAGIMISNLISLKSSENFKHSVSPSNFVEISKSLNSMRSFVKHVKNSKPVLLFGNAGSGKTFLVDEMARKLHIEDSNNLVKIHLNQQTDSKTLLGTYTSGTKPGTFEWKNGVLTTAVKEGKWILVEDIDKAPNEVLSILIGLLEHKEITLPSRGEVLKAGNGFQLIATVRSHNKEQLLPEIIGLRLWNVLKLEDLDEQDLKIILNKKFPLLKRYTNLFIKCYFVVKTICDSRKFVSMNKGAQPRQISIRDLMKFCRRCEHIFELEEINSADDLIHDEVFDTIFQEAIDCFTSAIAEKNPIEYLIKEIGTILEIPNSRIDLQLKRHVPNMENFDDALKIGRAYVPKQKIIGVHKYQNKVAFGNTTSFATTNHSARLMEKIGVGISMCEPLLLVGETGTGKTTVVQQMAKLLNKKLTVINLSQQTEVGDLLGGFKPINAKTIALPLEEDFEQLFARSFSTKNNAQFLKLLSKCFNKAQWKNVCRLWKEAFKMAKNTFDKVESEEENENKDTENDENKQKKKRKLNATEKSELMKEWKDIQSRVSNFEKQVIDMNNSFIFKFVEGSLVNAVKKGDWLLLDEMNLAAPETLDSISDLLAEYSDQRSVLLSEKGDVESIKANPDFRLFGCMNPATDVGKKDLPQSIRSRFTELYVSSPDQDIEDLLKIIDKYIGKYSLSDEWVGNDVAELYLEAKKLSDHNKIVDSSNQKPHFSIRTLTRTLLYARDITSIYGLRRSLYEGFCMSLLTLLDAKSEQLLMPLIQKYTIGRLKNPKSILNQIPANPSTNTAEFIQFRHYWMQKGPEEPQPQAHYIITPFVEKNMLNLVRATSGGRFPVLIQGPTSAGKTSMINYLAKITGHNFVRINNHEHTDLQEYLGTYVSDDTGKLIFKEGILVEALRKGHWIVLDELNLAPTDVLEALNRLLDDNRELFIPETQEIVRPHPDFMLFATQNPPGLYGGRKVLSKAFRNRFLELHFDDIPQDELEIILRERCLIAPTYAKKIVEVYKELGIKRQSARLFEQKNSFATLRDLFRWAQREAVGYEQLAANGYMLLAERVRRPEEKNVVKDALEKVMRVKLDMDSYYKNLEVEELLEMEGPVIWTKAMRRLAVLVLTSMQNNEPLLLVGETGCGKTTVCQMIAEFFKKELIIVNAHQNTETGDLLGSQRPIRNRSELQVKFINDLKEVLSHYSTTIDEGISYTNAVEFWNTYKKTHDVKSEDARILLKTKSDCDALFEWADGPLVNALKTGCYFLLDEISLADDSVLERLNSVLEPERSLLLAEKGSDDIFITANDGFQFLATMNPGGDYGKKELSPALRNRFTEIWVPSMEDFDDVRQIVRTKLDEGLKHLTDPIVNFSKWYGTKMGGGDVSSGVISLRDILAWITFINTAFKNGIPDYTCLLHGACMVFIDALGTHTTAYLAENEENLRKVKLEYVRKLSEHAKTDLIPIYSMKAVIEFSESFLKCGPFSLHREVDGPDAASFNLEAPTTASNAMRVIRALQVHKPILLEGSPGVGKTSLITALAQATGNNLTRINLSEQTDLIDLFGSDTPVEGGKAGEFVWRDAPYLRAMQKGEWVLLDEMNLASQSVLEGLNACLDHRGEVYIPELDKSFISHPNFKVFAAQNPQLQGGGRKGLPKSFINRFSVVYVDMLAETDLKLIAHHLYPSLDHDICDKLISFMSQLEEQVVIKKEWGIIGAPWEFNLRDTLRWLSLLQSPSISNNFFASDFFNLVVRQRFRTEADRNHADELFLSIFDKIEEKDSYYNLGKTVIQCQNSIINRNNLIQYQSDSKICHLQCNVPVLETIFRCIEKAYPLILVGDSGSGKSDLIKFAADVIGFKVYEFSMNSDIDSMDILGGYEQADHSRTFAKHAANISECLLKLVAVNAQLPSPESMIIVQCATKLIMILNEEHLSTKNILIVLEELSTLNKAIQNKEIGDLIEKLEILNNSIESGEINVNFEWFDGLLVEAVEKGYWLILDNANLCSPSVLDRLNSLLETNGALIINECTNEDGSPRIVKTHPDFRLFLTSDPKYGELSRAMRNRSVEVYVEPLKERATSLDKRILGMNDSENLDNQSLISKLDFLSITSTGKPLTYFSPVNDSNLYHTSLFIDYYNNIKFHSNSFDYSSFLQFTPISLVDTIFEFSNAAPSSSEILDSSFFAEIDRNIEIINDFGLCQSVTSLYNKAAKDSVLLSESKLESHMQPISLITNSSVILLVKHYASSVASKESLYLFVVLSLLADAFKFINQTHEKAKSSNISALNPLEQFYAISVGREIKKLPKINVYKWAVDILVFIKSQISLSVDYNHLLNSENVFAGLFKLLILWKNFVKASIRMNKTALHLYHDQLLEFIETNASIYDSELIRTLNITISKFSEELRLSRGSAMTLIWNSCRSVYPQTDIAWENYESLMELANKFDDVAFEQFSDNIANVNEFRKMFIDLFAACLEKVQDENFSSMLDIIKTKTEELSNISEEFLIKRSHPFKNNFIELLGFIESQRCFEKKNISLNTDNLTLCLLANQPTLNLVDMKKSSVMFKPYPVVFNLLWDKEGSLQLPLFDDKFLKSAMKVVSEISKTQGGNIEQSLFDLKFFISQLVSNSSEILSDHMANFANILKQWVKLMHNIHVELLDSVDMQNKANSLFESGTTDSFALYTDVFSKSNLNAYAEIFETYFVPVLTGLQKQPTKSTLGHCFILGACGFIMLYMPDSAYDPAAVDHILFDDFISLQNVITDIKNSFLNARTTYFGDSSILAEKYLPEVEQNKINEIPRVYRDSDSAEKLFEEWHLFFNSYIDKKHIDFLLTTAIEVTEKASSQVDNFIKNASYFTLRLKENHLKFSDLNDILIGFVHALKLGLHLLHDDSKDKLIKVPSSLWSSNAAVIYTPSQLDPIFERVKEICKKVSVNDYNVENIYSHFLLLSKTHNLLSYSGDQKDMFDKVLMSLYYRWSLRALKEKEKESTENGIFRFSDPTMDAEEDFKKLFPDSDDIIDLNSTGTSSEETMNEIYYNIAKVYIISFDSKTKASYDDIAKSSISAFTSLKKVCEVSGMEANTGSNLVFILSLLKDSYNKFTNSKASSEIDFYRGYDFAQTRAAGKIVRNVQISVFELLKKWPEHATLTDLFRICSEFLEYPSSTPIFRLLAKIEQIFTFISEWEKYAHSGVSLNVHYKSVSGLIVSWRQLELASWKQVFVNEEKTIEKNIGKWWFHLFETIIVPSINDEIFDEEIEIKVVAAINVFLSQATYGEFIYRLNLLTAFATHVKLIAPSATIYHSLLNIVSYYKQFLNQIDESISFTKKELEKKVNEIILLASWKDVNVDALKQSSRRSHHNLYKVIRKYRTCLLQPVKPLIEVGLAPSIKSHIIVHDAFKKMVKIPENINKLQSLCFTVDKSTNKASKLKNIIQIEKNMTVYISDIDSIKFRSLLEFAKELFSDSEKLRKETPNVYTKENKKVIAGLKNEKHKLFSDTIKDLRHMGLKLHMTIDIQKALPSVTAILATSVSLTNSTFDGSDVYFFRMLDLLPRLRSAVSEVHEDIPPAESQKCLAASEHLLYILLCNRNILIRCSQFSNSLEKIVSNLEMFTTESTHKLIPASKLSKLQIIYKNVFSFVEKFPTVLDFSIESIQNASTFAKKNFDSSIFYEAKVAVQKFFSNKYEILSSEDLKQVDEISKLYNNFIEKLENWKKQNVEVGFIADFLTEWLLIQNLTFASSDTIKKEPNTIEDLEKSLIQLFNSILLSVQKLHKLNFEVKTEEKEEEEDEDDESNWLIKNQKKLIRHFELLYPTSVLKKFNTCLEIMESIEYTENETLVASAMIEQLLPIIQNYFNLASSIQGKLENNFIDVSRGTYELSSLLHTICSKGFCQPELPHDEKEDNNLKEGTGLGDGEGAENNSNDVEEDDDLTEQAQQPNDEKNKNEEEEEENDDAVDIEGDMNGDLENISDQEDEEGDEKDEEQEDELDEEIDDLDDMDPNAIDDKMWDEEAQSSKEKESEEMPDNGESNNDMEAMEDEPEENQKENDDDKKDENDDSKPEDENKEENENDENAEEEEDVGEQDDEVKNEENEQFDDMAPEADALELPEDMNLDSEGDDSGDEEDEGDDKFEDNLDNEDDAEMKDDEEQSKPEDDVDVEMDNEEGEEEDQQDQEVEGEPADEEDNTEEENEEDDDGMNVDNEINEEGGVESDEELKEGEEETEENEEGNKDEEDANDEELEGVEGAETGANEVDDDSAVKQQSGVKSEGADADDNQENENIGASNGGADFQNDEEKEEKEEEDNENADPNESSRDKAAESMKQLGDSLKEFHKRRQEIKEATDDDTVDQKSGERPDEFQHLEGENADNDTQALGAANKEQIQSIDDDMAIEDDEKEEDADVEINDDNDEDINNVEEAKEVDNDGDVDMDDVDTNKDFEGQKRSGFINERNREVDEIPANIEIGMESESEDSYDEDEEDIGEINKEEKVLRPYEEAEDLWRKADESTRDLTSSLCEQLRLILEPTLSTKLKGDYKTGKRLNMKRIIPYIASQFRKDKIWMRRTKPSKRQYQIMISLDDSKSMAESHAVEIAFQSVALVSKALSQLESGQISIMKFGSKAEVVHPFEKQFGGNSGINIFREFEFDDTRTDIRKLVTKSLKVFNDARSFGDSDLWQLEIVLSDGVCEDHETIQRLVRKAREEKVMIVFVIIDGLNSKESILDMSQANYTTDESGKMKLQVTKYLDTFPFEFYVVVHNINELPEMLSLILRQYFTELASS